MPKWQKKRKSYFSAKVHEAIDFLGIKCSSTHKYVSKNQYFIRVYRFEINLEPFDLCALQSKICQNKSRSIQINPNTAKYFQIYPSISKFIQIYPNISKKSKLAESQQEQHSNF